VRPQANWIEFFRPPGLLLKINNLCEFGRHKGAGTGENAEDFAPGPGL
jgi:hypothetical protein